MEAFVLVITLVRVTSVHFCLQVEDGAEEAHSKPLRSNCPLEEVTIIVNLSIVYVEWALSALLIVSNNRCVDNNDQVDWIHDEDGAPCNKP